MSYYELSITLHQQFQYYSKLGVVKGDSKTLTLTQLDKWMKQAGVVEGKKITSTDLCLYFNTFKTRTITYQDFCKLIELMAEDKQTSVEDLREKLVNCGQPGGNKMQQQQQQQQSVKTDKVVVERT